MATKGQTTIKIRTTTLGAIKGGQLAAQAIIGNPDIDRSEYLDAVVAAAQLPGRYAVVIRLPNNADWGWESRIKCPTLAAAVMRLRSLTFEYCQRHCGHTDGDVSTENAYDADIVWDEVTENLDTLCGKRLKVYPIIRDITQTIIMASRVVERD